MSGQVVVDVLKSSNLLNVQIAHLGTVGVRLDRQMINKIMPNQGFGLRWHARPCRIKTIHTERD